MTENNNMNDMTEKNTQGASDMRDDEINISDVAKEAFYNAEIPDTIKKGALDKVKRDKSAKPLTKIDPSGLLEQKYHIPPDKISLNYLYDIFSPEYDKYKSREYLIKTREELLKMGYADGPALNEYLFWLTISRRLQIIYQEMHFQLVKAGGVSKENVEFLKRISAISSTVSKLQETLEDARSKREKASDVVDLFTETMSDVNKFIRKNIGEFSFRCRQCGTMVHTDGLPHFAIMTDTDDDGNKLYHIFSPEAAYLVKKKIIPLHAMAFILRTSPEGIIYTARARGDFKSKELLRDTVLSDEEDKLRDLIQAFNEYAGRVD